MARFFFYPQEAIRVGRGGDVFYKPEVASDSLNIQGSGSLITQGWESLICLIQCTTRDMFQSREYSVILLHALSFPSIEIIAFLAFAQARMKIVNE